MTHPTHQAITEEVAEVDRIIAKKELLIEIALKCGLETLVDQMRLELEEARGWRDCLSAGMRRASGAAS